MIRQFIFLCVCSLLTFTSCDTGDIWDEEKPESEGRICNVSLAFKNTSAWPVDYQIVLAAFEEGENYPTISKIISKPNVGVSSAITMSGISESADYITVSILNKSKKLVYNFYSYPINVASDVRDTLQLGTQEIDMLDYGRIQAQFFSNCVNCHGGSSYAAANLNLTEGESYNALVNKKSVKAPDEWLVYPGLTDKSFILDVLEGTTDSVAYNHKNVNFNSEEEDIQLLKKWIESL